jgi:hypothetical protein
MKRAVIRIDSHMNASSLLDRMAGDFIDAWNRGGDVDPVATFTFSSPAPTVRCAVTDLASFGWTERDSFCISPTPS